MSWSQVYDPLHNEVLSTIVAALPIVVLLGSLAFFHVKAHWAAILGLIVALAVSIFAFGMPMEMAGKSVFNRACAQCHSNLSGHPSGTTLIVQGTPGTPTALARYHDILTACPRPVDDVSPPRFLFTPCSPSQMENVRTYEITNSGVPPDGTSCGGAPPQPACVTRLTTSDPGRLLLTAYPAAGGPGDIQHMDIPNLRGISRTAPYFINNTAATLEEMLEHYKQFFKRVQVQNAAAPILTTQPGVVPPVIDRPFTDAETPALLAYLRKI